MRQPPPSWERGDVLTRKKVFQLLRIGREILGQLHPRDIRRVGSHDIHRDGGNQRHDPGIAEGANGLLARVMLQRATGQQLQVGRMGDPLVALRKDGLRA